MTAATDTIALGGRSFVLRPLKLGQLRHLLDALDAMNGKTGGGLIDAAAAVIAAGLAPAQPGLTTDAILDLEATLEELNGAVAAILQVAGLKPVGESDPPVAGSAASTAPSPPAAAIPIATSTG
jgi:hypothetical protein